MLAELAEPLLEWGARGRGPPRALKYPGCTPPGGGEGRRKRGRRPASLQIPSPPRPRVPGLAALGPSSCRRRRPEAPAAPRAIGGGGGQRHLPEVGFSVFLLGRESRESSLSSVALCHSPRLSSSPTSVSLVWNLSLSLLVRISLGPCPSSPMVSSFSAFYCAFISPFLPAPSFCPHLFPPLPLGFLKVALRRSPKHQVPDSSPELPSPFNCLKLRV